LEAKPCRKFKILLCSFLMVKVIRSGPTSYGGLDCHIPENWTSEMLVLREVRDTSAW